MLTRQCTIIIATSGKQQETEGDKQILAAAVLKMQRRSGEEVESSVELEIPEQVPYSRLDRPCSCL